MCHIDVEETSSFVCLLGKVEILLDSYFFFLKEKFVFFVRGFQIGMFYGSHSEDSAFCIEQFKMEQVNSR